MFLVPVLVVVVAALVGYRLLHAKHRVAAGATVPAVAVGPAPARPFWPSSLEGRIAIVAFVLGFVPIALVNVIQVAFLGWVVQLVALVGALVARFVRHDRSVAVLVVLVVTAIAVVASLVFLTGELLIGHD